MDYTTTCPGCGREITIPPDLDSCFCTYCGGKVERPAAPPPETSSFTSALSFKIRFIRAFKTPSENGLER